MRKLIEEICLLTVTPGERRSDRWIKPPIIKNAVEFSDEQNMITAQKQSKTQKLQLNIRFNELTNLLLLNAYTQHRIFKVHAE